MNMPLWTHQDAAIQAALDAVSAGRRTALWVMPTGSGKSLAFVELAHRISRGAQIRSGGRFRCTNCCTNSVQPQPQQATKEQGLCSR